MQTGRTIMDKEFWKALLIRTAKTWCQAFVATVGVDYAGRTLGEINWVYALSVATVAAIICFVWNLGSGLPEVQLQQTLYDLDNWTGIEYDEGEDIEDEEDFDDEEEGEE